MLPDSTEALLAGSGVYGAGVSYDGYAGETKMLGLLAASVPGFVDAALTSNNVGGAAASEDCHDTPNGSSKSDILIASERLAIFTRPPISPSRPIIERTGSFKNQLGDSPEKSLRLAGQPLG